TRLLASSRSRIVDSESTVFYYMDVPRYTLETGLVLALAPVAAFIVATAGSSAAAELVLFAAVAFRVLPSISRMLQQLGFASYSAVAARELASVQRDLDSQICDMKREILTTDCPPPFLEMLRFEDVSFSYPILGNSEPASEVASPATGT